VKILLGVNFLGEIQINYISNQVLNSVKNYSLNRLPSVLIFDEYNAAAAISIDPDGYRIKALAFKSSANLSEEQMNKYKHDIIKIVDNINIHNQKAFRKKLKNYYSR